MSELHISQAFQQHQARQIPTPYELMVKFCSKYVVNSFSCIFWGIATWSHVARTTQGLKGRMPKKRVCFGHRILGFHFLSNFVYAHGSTWCHVQCDCSNLNMKSLIFSRNFTSSKELEFWIKSLINKKNFNSLTLAHLRVEFEPCVLNFI
jgi:hypothetical protein